MSHAASVLGGSAQPVLTKFYEKIRVGSENLDSMTVTQVHLSKDPELEQHFQYGVSILGFQLTFLDGTSNPFNCLLTVYENPRGRNPHAEWRRIFPYHTIKIIDPTREHRSLSDSLIIITDYVVIVDAGVRVVAEHRLPKQTAGKLTGVSVRATLITNELYKGPRCTIAQ